MFCISNTVWTSVLALNSENYHLEAFNFLVAWWGIISLQHHFGQEGSDFSDQM